MIGAIMAAIELEEDPVVEAYKGDVDRTLLRENPRRTVQGLEAVRTSYEPRT